MGVERTKGTGKVARKIYKMDTKNRETDAILHANARYRERQNRSRHDEKVNYMGKKAKR